jgi:hypothetical protein
MSNSPASHHRISSRQRANEDTRVERSCSSGRSWSWWRGDMLGPRLPPPPGAGVWRNTSALGGVQSGQHIWSARRPDDDGHTCCSISSTDSEQSLSTV